MQERPRHPGRILLLIFAIVATSTVIALLSRRNLAVGQSFSAGSPADASAIQALAIQIRPGQQGIALIDKKRSTICIYQYQAQRPVHERFVLLAARSFRYDCQLEEFNTGEPSPAAVRQLLQRRQDILKQQPTPTPVPARPEGPDTAPKQP